MECCGYFTHEHSYKQSTQPFGGRVITKLFPKTPEEPTHSLLTEVICELTFDCYAKTLFKILLKATAMHVIKIEYYIKHTVDEHIIYWFPLANLLRSLSRDLYFN